MWLEIKLNVDAAADIAETHTNVAILLAVAATVTAHPISNARTRNVSIHACMTILARLVRNADLTTICQSADVLRE